MFWSITIIFVLSIIFIFSLLFWDADLKEITVICGIVLFVVLMTIAAQLQRPERRAIPNVIGDQMVQGPIEGKGDRQVFVRRAGAQETTAAEVVVRN